MSNQFHRLLTNAELHRPERTGRGNPNLLTDDVEVEGGISQVEDGQYYQDITTGDIYRFVKFDSAEEFDRYGQFIGSTTSTIQEGDVRKRIDVTNESVSSTSGLTLLDGQSLILQDDLGNFQVVLVDGKQTFVSSTFSVKVRSFTHEFAIGGEVNGALISSNKDGKWERLISYDRETESITNVLLKAESEAIGEITQAFGGSLEEVVVQQERVVYKYNGVVYETFGEAEEAAVDDGVERDKILEGEIKPIKIDAVKEVKKVLGDVTQITANLFTEITEGQELVVFARNSQGNLTSDSIKLTVNDNGDDVTDSYGAGENVVIDVQDDKTLLQFPVGSLIFSEDSYRESSLRVDPSRIQLGVIGGRIGDGIGTLSSNVSAGNTSSLSLKDIDETVNLKDDQTLILVNRFGEVKKVTVNGNQTLTPSTGSITVDPFTIAEGDPVFEANTSIVKEPSYASSSRITLQDDSITLAVSKSNDALNATASIDTRVGNLESSITNTVTWNDSTGFTRLSAGPEGSSFVVQADQISINGTTTFGSGYDPSTKETPGGAQSKADSARNQARENVASNLGYANYSDMVSEAQAGKTIISGGFIRTSLIQADAVLANQILAQDANITGDLTLSSSSGSIKASRVRLDSTRGIRFNSDYSFGSDPSTDPDKFTTVSFGSLTGNADLYLSYDSNDDALYFIDDNGDISSKIVVDNIECTTLTETSDRYQKENIEDIGPTLSKLVQLDGKRYDMLGPSTTKNLGLLAQDVEPLFPETVRVGKGENEDGEEIEHKTLAYTQFVPILIESIKELKEQNEELKTRIEALEQQS